MQAHFQAFNIHSALRKAKSYKYHYSHFVKKLLHKRLSCMWVGGEGAFFKINVQEKCSKGYKG